MRSDSGLTRRNFVARAMSGAAGALLVPVRRTEARQTVSSPGIGDAQLLEDLVAANRILAHHGIVDAWGHVSARNRQAPNRYFLSRSLAPALVTPGDIIEFDFDGNSTRPDARPLYLERFIHGEIYRARPDINAVVHCHAPSLIPFGVSTVPLRPVYHLAAFIGDGLPVFEIRATAGMTDMLVSDRDRGRALALALGGKPAALMRGHGAVVVGASLPVAVGRSIYLDINATLQATALALGGPIRYLDPQEAGHVMAAGENGEYARGWELWKQQATSK
jgi:HCOMODA/2-hydroxy-3-carboxy-muconic semialdehyde decarboxylase